MKQILILAALFTALVSCTKQSAQLSTLAADNFTINFPAGATDTVKITDQVNGHIYLFAAVNGTIQTAHLDEPHTYSIEWVCYVSETSSCAFNLDNDNRHVTGIYLNTLGRNVATAINVEYAPNMGFSINCR